MESMPTVDSPAYTCWRFVLYLDALGEEYQPGKKIDCYNLLSLLSAKPEVALAAFQLEMGETGKWHYCGNLRLANPGNIHQVREYLGIEQLELRAIDNDSSLEMFPESSTGISSFRSIGQSTREDYHHPPQVEWFWGEGYTHSAQLLTAVLHADSEPYIWRGTDEKWSDYHGQSTLIIDLMSGHELGSVGILSREELLQLFTGRYQLANDSTDEVPARNISGSERSLNDGIRGCACNESQSRKAANTASYLTKIIVLVPLQCRDLVGDEDGRLSSLINLELRFPVKCQCRRCVTHYAISTVLEKAHHCSGC